MKTSTSQYLTRLRKYMKDEATTGVETSLSAYIVPSRDAHNSEYLADCDQRRAFISGFDGSAGTAIITAKDALMWTDGRYYLQAAAQMDGNWTLMKEGHADTLSKGDWLEAYLEPGATVGVDPFLMPVSEYSDLKRKLSNLRLVSVERNLVDLVWGCSLQPGRPDKPIMPLELDFTGQSWEEKVGLVRMKMKEKKADVLILSALDDVAWLLNLRGSDIVYNPVFFSYVSITPHRVYLYVNEVQITDAVRRHLKPQMDANNVVEIKPYDAIKGYLSGLKGKKIWLSNHASQGLVSLSTSANKTMLEVTPVCLMKAVKNKVELEGFSNSHIRDAAALCSYFAWLEKQIPSGTVTEISGAEQLALLRAEMQHFVGLSFETISAAGPNGAIIHYKPTEDTNRTLTTEELYLVDSGGQYKDGTTDVTRTVHFGTPREVEKECFTRVLQGQIRVAKAVFPDKLKGNCLDSLARMALWEVGLDYAHGTGHGVGHYLNVHEGPMGISWRPYPDDPGLTEGMILSDEPGYYKDGEFGIRIENLVKIVKADTPYRHQNKDFLTFENLTVVPVQTKMINPGLLSQEEIHYINQYHQMCRDQVGPLLREMGKKDGLRWLIRETEPIG